MGYGVALGGGVRWQLEVLDGGGVTLRCRSWYPGCGGGGGGGVGVRMKPRWMRAERAYIVYFVRKKPRKKMWMPRQVAVRARRRSNQRM